MLKRRRIKKKPYCKQPHTYARINDSVQYFVGVGASGMQSLWNFTDILPVSFSINEDVSTSVESVTIILNNRLSLRVESFKSMAHRKYWFNRELDDNNRIIGLVKWFNILARTIQKSHTHNDAMGTWQSSVQIMCKPFAEWPFYCDRDDDGGLNGEMFSLDRFRVCQTEFNEYCFWKSVMNSECLALESILKLLGNHSITLDDSAIGQSTYMSFMCRRQTVDCASCLCDIYTHTHTHQHTHRAAKNKILKRDFAHVLVPRFDYCFDIHVYLLRNSFEMKRKKKYTDHFSGSYNFNEMRSLVYRVTVNLFRYQIKQMIYVWQFLGAWCFCVNGFENVYRTVTQIPFSSGELSLNITLRWRHYCTMLMTTAKT